MQATSPPRAADRSGQGPDRRRRAHRGPVDKWQIEEYIRDLGVPVTILRPAGFMEDFTSPARFFQHGSLNVPWHDDLVMQFIAIDDTGAFAALAFADPDTYLGRAMEITGDRLTAPQIADALSTAAGRPVPHVDFGGRLDRSGKARLLAHLEPAPFASRGRRGGCSDRPGPGAGAGRLYALLPESPHG